MTAQPDKMGRPRRYGLPAAPGFLNHDAARLVAALDELSERAFDQIEDLPPSALEFAPQGATNTICLLYTSPSPRDGLLSRMPSSA